MQLLRRTMTCRSVTTVQCYANCLQINYAAKAASACGVTTLTVSHQIGLEAECAGNYLDKLL